MKRVHCEKLVRVRVRVGVRWLYRYEEQQVHERQATGVSSSIDTLVRAPLNVLMHPLKALTDGAAVVDERVVSQRSN